MNDTEKSKKPEIKIEPEIKNIKTDIEKLSDKSIEKLKNDIDTSFKKPFII